MEFLTTGQKIRQLRKTLKMTQQDLQGDKIKRNFISMIENGERGLTKDTANMIAEKFHLKAIELGMQLDITAAYLLTPPQEEARHHCIELLDSSPDLESLDEAIEVSENYHLFDISARAYMMKGNLAYSLNKYKQAFVLYLEALDMFKNADSNEWESYLFNKLGLCALNQLNYLEAIQYFYKARYYSLNTNDESALKNSIYNLALCYRKLSNQDQAIEYIDEYLNLCDKSNDLTNYVYANIIKANCYRDKQAVEKATDIYNSLLVNEKSLTPHLLGFIYDNLGMCYCEMNQYDKSLAYFDKSQEIRAEQDIGYLHHTIIDKSVVYYKQGLHNESEILINLGISMAKKQNDYEYMLKGHYILADIYTEQHNYDQLENIYLKSIDIINISTKDYIEISKIYTLLSLMHLNNGNIEKAKNYSQLSLSHLKYSDKKENI